MAGFLYFSPNHELPEEFAYAFEDTPISREVYNGPGGKPGFVYGSNRAFSENPNEVGYHKDRQTWISQPIVPSAFVGFFPDNKPTESDLRRDKQLPGKHVVMDDGSKWLVPVARSWNAQGQYTVELPQTLGITQDGIMTANDVVLRYRGLWETAQRIADGLFQPVVEDDENENEIKSVIKIDDAFFVLQANYLVSQIEMGMLGIMTTDLLFEIGQIVIDLAGLLELKKNEVAAVVNTGDGPPVSIPATAQQ